METRPVLTTTDMEKLTPNQRADAINRGVLASTDDLPEPFRSRVIAKATALNESLNSKE